MENKPVNFVSWYDAIRFANWLHNGQGSGDTEDGAYTLLGRTPTPSNGHSITRNPGARWWLPSEDEWYKAAYHKNDGVTGNYWDFPTNSDSVPIAEPPPGGTNSANYNFAIGTVSELGAYVGSPGPYGTFDQGGNAFEWNETENAGFRGLRGGAWFNNLSFILHAAFQSGNDPADVNNFFGGLGFRVASIPEPAATCLGMLGVAMLLFWRRVRH
jgi:formylglycine-generating enzyme required for sulfatase activity